ncbi:MAG: hypothetical protein AM1032_000299 [Mycoplasmataceae bacterium]|nr:MAG: hypothetical protein AM1032_000299 [Mycoplasmataceae bacterium]
MEKINNLNNLKSEMILIISNIKEDQKFLDNLIHSKKNLSFSETFNLRKLALLVEIGEFSNELETFKYWKINKKSRNDEKIKEELIDCLHFFISIFNDLKVLIDESYKFNYDNFSLNDLLLEIFDTTNQFSIEMKNPEFICNNWLYLFFEICNNLGISSKEVLNAYSQKNKLNIERLNNNY